MKSFDGVEIVVGLPVVVVETPIVEKHRLVAGVVTKITAKRIHVKTALVNWEGKPRTLLRNAEQIMAGGELV